MILFGLIYALKNIFTLLDSVLKGQVQSRSPNVYTIPRHHATSPGRIMAQSEPGCTVTGVISEGVPKSCFQSYDRGRQNHNFGLAVRRRNKSLVIKHPSSEALGLPSAPKAPIRQEPPDELSTSPEKLPSIASRIRSSHRRKPSIKITVISNLQQNLKTSAVREESSQKFHAPSLNTLHPVLATRDSAHREDKQTSLDSPPHPSMEPEAIETPEALTPCKSSPKSTPATGAGVASASPTVNPSSPTTSPDGNPISMLKNGEYVLDSAVGEIIVGKDAKRRGSNTNVPITRDLFAENTGRLPSVPGRVPSPERPHRRVSVPRQHINTPLCMSPEGRSRKMDISHVRPLSMLGGGNRTSIIRTSRNRQMSRKGAATGTHRKPLGLHRKMRLTLKNFSTPIILGILLQSIVFITLGILHLGASQKLDTSSQVAVTCLHLSLFWISGLGMYVGASLAPPPQNNRQFSSQGARFTSNAPPAISHAASIATGRTEIVFKRSALVSRGDTAKRRMRT